MTSCSIAQCAQAAATSLLPIAQHDPSAMMSLATAWHDPAAMTSLTTAWHDPVTMTSLLGMIQLS